MAFSAHKDEDSIKERVEDATSVDKKVTELVDLIRKAKCMVVFTGAGVSTSAGIPDFRGPDGVWTMQAQGRMRSGPTTSTLKAMPTATHMSLVALQNARIMKYLISQNVDGLHRRSGILPQNISELHGNENLETCRACGKEYLRDFSATAHYRTSVHDHRTGRKCDVCGKELHDSIINFAYASGLGENLPKVPLDKGWEISQKADLHLVLGSSLTVSPANAMPKLTAKNGFGKLVIVNLQKTPLDDRAAIRIFAKCDDVMRLVMAKLGLDIPPFILSRNLRITETAEKTKKTILIDGVDVDGIPVSFVKSVTYKAEKMTQEPFRLVCDADKKSLHLRLDFRGHYNEPALELDHALADGQQQATHIYRMDYNPLLGKWKVSPAAGIDQLSVPADQQKRKDPVTSASPHPTASAP